MPSDAAPITAAAKPIWPTKIAQSPKVMSAGTALVITEINPILKLRKVKTIMAPIVITAMTLPVSISTIFRNDSDAKILETPVGDATISCRLLLATQSSTRR